MAFLSLTVGACAIVESESDLQGEGDHQAAVAEIPSAVPSKEPAPVQPVRDEQPDISRPEMSIPGVKEIRFLQEGLRASGFDPGVADGILGPKTRQAWLRLASACATLQDLVESAEPANNELGLLRTIAADKLSDQEQIRIIQVRLKDAGFDPGLIDGIVGPKTTSALIRLHSGCLLARNFSTSSSGELLYTNSGATPPRTSDIAVSLPPPESSATRRTLGRLSNPHRAAATDRETVRRLQVRLKNAGFDPGPLDGVMGPRTRTALERYQAYLGACNCQEISPGLTIHQ